MIKKPLRGELWMVDLDPTIGREQAKKRPCLIFSTNLFNRCPAELSIVIPLTSKDKKNPLHITIPPTGNGLSVKSFALCEQIRSVSHNRFDKFLGIVREEIMHEIEYVVKTLLDL